MLKTENSTVSNIFFSVLVFVILLGTSGLLLDQTTPIRQCACVLISAVLYFGWLKNKQKEMSVPLLFLVFVAFLLWQFCSLFYSGNISLVYPELIKNVTFFFLCIFFANQFASTSSIKDQLIKILVVVSLCWNVVGMIDFFRHSSHLQLPDKDNYFVASTFANKNLFSSALMLVLPLSFYLLFSGSKRWQTLSCVNIILSLFLIINLNTKSVWIAVSILSTLSFVFFVFRFNKNRAAVVEFLKSNKLYFIGILSSLILFLLLKGATASYKPRGKFDQVLNASARESVIINSANERVYLWKKSYSMFTTSPVTGVGTGNWKREINNYVITNSVAEKGNIYFISPHNETVKVFCENGIIGAILFTVFFLFLILKAFRLSIQNNNQFADAFLSLLGITGFLIYSQFEFPLNRPEHLFLLAIYAGLLFTGEKKKVNFKGHRFIVLPLVCIGLWYSIVELKFNYYVLKVHQNRLVQNWNAVLKYTKSANNTFMSSDMNGIPLDWQVGLAYFNQGDLTGARASFEKAYKLFPYNLHVLNNLATCYNLMEESAKAKTYYKEALRISDHFDEARLNLCIVLFNENKRAECYLELRKISDRELLEKNIDFVLDVIDPDKQRSFNGADEIFIFFEKTPSL